MRHALSNCSSMVYMYPPRLVIQGISLRACNSGQDSFQPLMLAQSLRGHQSLNVTPCLHVSPKSTCQPIHWPFCHWPFFCHTTGVSEKFKQQMFIPGILGISFTSNRTLRNCYELNCQEYLSSQGHSFLFVFLCNTYLGHCSMGGAGQVRLNFYFD